jgi:transcriptional regulator with XRE-family HTH domain
VAASDTEKAEARRLIARGLTQEEVAERLNVHHTTIGRWKKEWEAEDQGPGPASSALEALLRDRSLNPHQNFLAATARQLAGKLDEARDSPAVGAFQSMPMIAKGLVDIVASILGSSEDDREWVTDLFT